VTLPGFHEAVVPGQHAKITSIQDDFTPEALEQLRFWLEQNPPSIPITQILGFVGFQFQAAPIVGTNFSESTASGTYVDLPTVGPALTNVSDGQYAIFFGAQITAGIMTVTVNNAAPVDDDSIVAAVAGSTITTSRLLLKTLKAGGNNSLQTKYRSTGGTATYWRRWLIAMKYANA
jgi:hypothetical protein